jgi:hypothetical protein
MVPGLRNIHQGNHFDSRPFQDSRGILEGGIQGEKLYRDSSRDSALVSIPPSSSQLR